MDSYSNDTEILMNQSSLTKNDICILLPNTEQGSGDINSIYDRCFCMSPTPKTKSGKPIELNIDNNTICINNNIFYVWTDYITLPNGAIGYLSKRITDKFNHLLSVRKDLIDKAVSNHKIIPPFPWGSDINDIESGFMILVIMELVCRKEGYIHNPTITYLASMMWANVSDKIDPEIMPCYLSLNPIEVGLIVYLGHILDISELPCYIHTNQSGRNANTLRIIVQNIKDNDQYFISLADSADAEIQKISNNKTIKQLKQSYTNIFSRCKSANIVQIAMLCDLVRFAYSRVSCSSGIYRISIAYVISLVFNSKTVDEFANMLLNSDFSWNFFLSDGFFGSIRAFAASGNMNNTCYSTCLLNMEKSIQNSLGTMNEFQNKSITVGRKGVLTKYAN